MNLKLLALLAFPLSLSACSTGPKTCPHCHADLTRPANIESPVKDSAAPSRVLAQDAGSRTIKLAPAAIFEKAQQALKADNFEIASAQNGIIITGWKEYPGEFHVVRRWEERSRFRVTIVPDIANPTTAGRIEVIDETQRRSNERADWEPANPRPQRSADLARAIESKL